MQELLISLFKWSFEDNENSSQYDRDIQKDGVVFDIVGIESHLFIKSVFISSVDLSHTSNARFDREYLPITLIVETNFSWLMRTRSHE